MITTYLVIGLVSSVLLAACIAGNPSGDRTRERSASRRRRFVEQNPTHVNSQDIRSMLVEEGVTVEQSHFITDKAAAHGIKPFTMWLWLQQFDAEVLSIVVAADLTHRDLLTHISNGTVPDLEELKLFASANGLAVGGARPSVRRGLVDSGTAGKKRPPLPPIFEPGTWPGAAPAAASSAVADDATRRREGDGGLAA